MTLLQMSLSGGCVILAAILLRALARNRLPGWTFSALWGAAWLRLMLPVALPSRLSAWALARRWMAAATPTPVTPPLSTETVVEAPRALQTLRTVNPTLSAPQGTLSVWTLIWFIGMLLCLSALCASYLRWRRAFRKSAIVDNSFTRAWLAAHPLRRRLSVRVSSAISAPLTYGVLRPVILLPEDTDWADEETLSCALAHEYAHIRRLDALRKPLLALAPCAHWFNPLAWAMWVLANRDIELACDGAAIRRLGADSRRAYALALLKLEERRGNPAAFAAFGRNAIEERIGAIMKHRRIKLPALLLAILLVFGVTAAFATTAPGSAAMEDAAADEADYSVYEPFGLVYAGNAGDTYRTNYTYGGQTVRFFYDPVTGANFTNFKTGAVDVEAVYEDGRLIGLKECSQEDYDRRTERFERAFGKAAASAPGDAAQEMPAEVAGTASEEDDWLKEYESLGVTRDAESGKWLYDGAPIRALIDPEAEAVFRSDDGTVRLAALRDGAGEVCALEELTESEANQLMRALNPQGASTAVEAASPSDAEMTETALTRLAANHPEMAAWVRAQYPDAVWWTVEAYAAQMEERQQSLRSEEGRVIGWNSDGAVTITPETIEEARAEDGEILSLLADGWLISKSIGGDENLYTRIDPAEWESNRSEAYELR